MQPEYLCSEPLASASPGQADVLIVGAGPAGLSLAIALGQAGLSVTVVEQQGAAELAAPAPDGREIALTHPNVHTLHQLGTWQHLGAHEVGLLRQAQIHDGPVGQRSPLWLHAGGSGVEHLGWIVPNHALRRSAWEVASQTPGVTLITSAQVTQVLTYPSHAELHYRDTQRPEAALQVLQAPLLVAADSRFSATRRQLGIGASLTDFGRSVIVCRMRHELAHGEVTHECFGYERTLAILPLPDDLVDGSPLCSAVITADSAHIQALLALPEGAFSELVQTQFQHRLGHMELTGQRHSYPLVATYAHRFAAQRCVLVGDAAVGMHPVTAHGFNIGLAGVMRLAQVLAQAFAQGQDWGAAAVLARYAGPHHRHAWPLFQGTNAIVRLYTDDRPLPRLLRQAVLAGSNRFPPLKAAIISQLTGRRPAWPRPLP